jgi:hypothetical protein
MNNNKNSRPILYKGEVYSQVITKRVGGEKKEPKVSYEQARSKALADIAQTKTKINNIPREKKLPNEFVVCLRLSPEFSAKSYYPTTLLSSFDNSRDTKEIGSRVWNKVSDDGISETGKLLFLRTTNAGLEKLESRLAQEESSLPKAFVYDVRKIQSIDTLTSSEQISGIPADWQEGRLEAVLHPFGKDKDVVLQNFLSLLESSGVELSKVKYKQYEIGVTFLSLYGNRKLLEKVSEYNPLRKLHTLDIRDIPKVTRGSAHSGGPIPATGNKPEVVVGVFDGGVNPNNPFIKEYTEEIDSINSVKVPEFLDHGTQVCGAVLYGPLNSYSSGDVLPTPKVSVKSFRVMPPLDIYDPDLYDVITAIEEVVPNNPEIKVYNLSLGPDGPILDDHISRFTYACDLLSSKYDVLFTVAVGNDGESTGDLARIQSPSDMANGLGIGAYTKKDGKIIRAPYSCLGPGREGSKYKPDLLAFGGCEQHPIHLVSQNLNEKIWNAGTSFASPIVAGYAGQLIGYSEGAIDPLVARALLIHTVNSEDSSSHNIETGHGTLPESVEEIITCKPNSYTLIYKGELPPGKYAQFSIPWDSTIVLGKVNFRWSVAVSTEIDSQSPDDYTASSAVMSFYPNKNKFVFTKKDEITGSKKSQTVDVIIERQTAEQLLSDGWEQAPFPASDSSRTPYATEAELRSDMKWDSIDTRTLNKKVSSVNEPFFHIHALSRGIRNNTRKIKFAVVLTVEPTDNTVDLYAKVIARYNALVPITLNLVVVPNVSVEV